MTLAAPLPRHHAAPPPSRRGLNRVEAAEYVGISPSKFDDMVSDGRMPQPKRVDARKIWDRHALDLAFDRLPSDEISEADSDFNEWDVVHETTK